MGDLSNSNFHFWFIESDLDGYLYSIFAPLNLGPEITIDLGKRKDLAYAHDVSIKQNCLVEGVSSLQVLQKLTLINQFPVVFSGQSITRHEWYRISLDLILFRFSAIRDYALNVVNSVYELGLTQLEVNPRKVKKIIRDKYPSESFVVNKLDRISEVGGTLRKERNILAHEGMFDGFDQDLEFNKVLAMFEDANKVSPHYKEFEANYSNKMTNLYETLVKESNQLVEELTKLCNHIANEFGVRYEKKSQ